ncbi:MAG: hypothetical protein GY953_54810, partial [bacterium]|nr:hypothetical protein [bacterium]
TLLLFLCSAMLAAAGDFQTGAAAVRITPPEGAAMSGYYYNRSAEGVHDDLFAKALVFEKDGSKAAIVSCDLSSAPRNIVEEARRLIADATGIPAKRVMIGATHTHTGPVIISGKARYSSLEGEMLRITKQYSADLPQLIANSVKQANAALAPAAAEAATGHEDSLTFNRRFHMKNGSVGWNPGKLDPEIIRPAGPIDAEVPVAYFATPDGKPVATYVNHALHLDTVGGLLYSADYPYTLAKQLGEARGPEMVTLFSIGCAGNLNHRDVKDPGRQKGHGEAARIGTVLAGEVLDTYKRLVSVPTNSVLVRSAHLKLPLAEFDSGDLNWAERVAKTYGKKDAAPFNDLVRAFKIKSVAERKGKPLDAEVQVIAIGDHLAWVGLPGEFFPELGRMIQISSLFRF